MTDVSQKKTVELWSFKTEKHVSNMTLAAINSMKTEKEWRIKKNNL